jgi:DNA end-binding protein Ku
MARAIWKGELVLGKSRLPVQMFSAVQDQAVHFRLLHSKDRVPVEQRIVRKSDGREVPKEDRRKAYPLDRDRAVVLQPDELEQLEPEASREIHFCRFVRLGVLGDQWFDRPYYLGPDKKDDADYFAVADAVAQSNVVGVARWVMRKKRYLGALTSNDGYLVMTTLRRADQVISVSQVEVPASRRPDEREIRMAEQLVSSIEGDFEPQLWKNEYRQRVRELIDAKARGKIVKLAPAKRKPSGGDLADLLQRSLAGTKERKVA